MSTPCPFAKYGRCLLAETLLQRAIGKPQECPVDEAHCATCLASTPDTPPSLSNVPLQALKAAKRICPREHILNWATVATAIVQGKQVRIAHRPRARYPVSHQPHPHTRPSPRLSPADLPCVFRGEELGTFKCNCNGSVRSPYYDCSIFGKCATMDRDREYLAEHLAKEHGTNKAARKFQTCQNCGLRKTHEQVLTELTLPVNTQQLPAEAPH